MVKAIQILTGVGISLIIVIAFLAGYMHNFYDFSHFSNRELTKTPVRLASANYSNQVFGFYNYNINNRYEYLTDEELKEQGGVCRHYADWYVKQATKDGFNAKRLSFPVDEDGGHSIAVIANSGGYCILDSTTVIGCGDFANRENE